MNDRRGDLGGRQETMNIREEMQQLVMRWSGTSKIDSKMGMIRTFKQVLRI
jgi:hypothetical protein